MTQITADIRDALGQPLVGYILVDLDYDLDNDSTYFLSVPVKVPLVNGQASFNLEPSVTARVSYVFSIYQTGDVLVKEPFRARIADSLTPVPLASLAPSGITRDGLDGSVASISRRLVTSEYFWARFQDNLIVPKGAYSAASWYQRGNIVLFQGGSYVFTAQVAAQGQPPTAGQANTYWMPIALPGQTVVGALDPGILATLATKTEVNAKVSAVDAALTRPALVGSLAASDRSQLLANTGWVQALADEMRKALVPIGTVCSFAGTSAPSRWLLCDGRTVLRSAYADLFAVLGTAFNLGGEAVTDFRLPDLRGRAAVGADQMSALQGAANRLPTALFASGAGSSSQVLTVAQMPAHDHGGATGQGSGIPTGYFTGGGSTSGVQMSSTLVTTFPSNLNAHTHTIPSQGNGQPFSIVQPYQAFNTIIYTGV